MLSIVTYKWKPKPGYRSAFGPETVNVLRNMVKRHYARPHRFILVTDDAAGVDADIEIVPLWDDYAAIPNPFGARQPSCYRRLKGFSREAKRMFGDRFVALDLDVIITADLAPVWDRDEEFVIWGDTSPRTPYNGSMMLMSAGARAKVWEEFDPNTSPAQGRRLGYFGSDQAWIGACLGPNEAKWSKADGVYSWRNDIAANGGGLPDNARIVMFHGKVDPWSPEAQQCSWVREHYR